MKELHISDLIQELNKLKSKYKDPVIVVPGSPSYGEDGQYHYMETVGEVINVQSFVSNGEEIYEDDGNEVSAGTEDEYFKNFFALVISSFVH
jgi:hypothetical protein